MSLPKIAVKTYQTTLPVSGVEIEFRPYLVKEERALLMANQEEDETQMLTAMLNIVQACVQVPQEFDARKLSDVDLQWLFVHTRAKSVGEDIEFKQKCPECDKEFNVRFNLEDIKVQKDDSHSTTYKIDLGQGNGENDLIIDFSLPTAETFISASKVDGDIDQIFFLIESCIEKIAYQGNVQVRGQDFQQADVQEFFDQLPSEHLEKIYSQVFATAPKMVHEFNTKCPHCGHEILQSVEGLANFFA